MTISSIQTYWVIRADGDSSQVHWMKWQDEGWITCEALSWTSRWTSTPPSLLSQTFDLLGADVKLSGALTTGRLWIGCWVSLQTPSATSVLIWRVRYDRNQLWGHSGLDLTHLYQNKRQKNHHESTCDALDHFYFEKPLQNSATLRPALDACDWVAFRLMHDSRGTIIDWFKLFVSYYSFTHTQPAKWNLIHL